jgi:hypothetical protein
VSPSSFLGMNDAERSVLQSTDALRERQGSAKPSLGSKNQTAGSEHNAPSAISVSAERPTGWSRRSPDRASTECLPVIEATDAVGRALGIATMNGDNASACSIMRKISAQIPLVHDRELLAEYETLRARCQ